MRNFWSASIEYLILVKVKKWFFFKEELVLEFTAPIPRYFLARSESLAKALVFYSNWWRKDLFEPLKLNSVMSEVISSEVLEKTLYVKQIKKITFLDMVSQKITEEDFMDYVIERIEGQKNEVLYNRSD